MCPEKHAGSFQLSELLVVYSDKPCFPQPLALFLVVDDISQRIKRVSVAQFLLRFLNGGCDAEAEAAAFVNFYGHSLLGCNA